ncbi:MAG TPA: ArsA-related P-loop ATPase [Solirubrobacteraceae bacterium]|jgi:anion-transporting  ArsA/GET3 family ATPase|nr:ArsA-related P-loop ATPase [Solirubrobacteraceae bacterium]
MTGRRSALAERLKGVDVCVCVGPGGVGKTTVSAAIGLGLAARGQKVLVLSIDPARRLAGALGLAELPDEPHRIPDSELSRIGIAAGGGELWATMLDSKRTFDGLVGRLSADEQARDAVLSNRIYRELSSAVAGSQEFTAVARLYELHRSGEWDAIVLDTPPSRNALDFLDAPERLTRFLEGRALRLLLTPRGVARGVFGRGAGAMLSLLSRVSGVDVLGELSGFFGSLGGMTDAFVERARGVQTLLRAPGTRFLIVTSPHPEAALEARYLHAQLGRARMRTAGVVVNMVERWGLCGRPQGELEEMLASQLGTGLAARVAANLAEFDVLTRRDAVTVEALGLELDEGAPLLVERLDGDPQDLAGIGAVSDELFL